MTLYAINTETMGVSEYAGLDPVSVVTHEGQAFVASATVLSELVGETDNGADIDAYVQTGQLDLGALPNKKRVLRAYLVGSADQGLTLTTIAEELGVVQERDYDALPPTGDASESRIKLSHGARSVYWGVRLSNINGGSLTIRQLDLLSAPVARRVQP